MACALAAGCGSTAPVVDVADAGVDAAVADVAPPGPCSTHGAGRLRVTVSLDPSIDRNRADVWLAARCGAQTSPVQVLRWDGSSSQSLEGLGPGSWQVYASSFLAPGAWSPRVDLAGAATAAVTVTLQGNAPVLGRYDSATGGDAGVPPTGDAGVTVDAGGLPGGTWRGVAPVSDPDDGTVGWLEVSAGPAGAGMVAVQLVVRNACTAAPCPSLSLTAAEARTLDGDTPVDLGAIRYAGAPVALGVGESAPLPQPIVLRGGVPDGRHGLQVALFGLRVSAAANGH